MKKIFLAVTAMILMASVFAVGCGEQPPATVTVTQQPGEQPTVTVTSEPTPTEPARSAEVINVYSGSFGSSSYSLSSALESISKEHHPWLRIVNTETAGMLWTTQQWPKSPGLWPSSMTIWTPGIIGFAEEGYPPFTEPIDWDFGQIQAVLNLNMGFGTLVTLDKELADDPMKLAGKRVALGRAAQTRYAIQQEFLLDAHGVSAESLYLGATDAVEALLDGRADACVMVAYSSGDQSVWMPSDALVQLEASGREFHWVNWDKDKVDALVEEQFPKGRSHYAYEIAAGNLSNQPDPIIVLADPNGYGVHETFDEELAYEFVKLALEHYETLPDYHALGKLTIPATMVSGYPADTFHPGAIRAYQEAGVWEMAQ